MADVFISYKKEDRAVAERVAHFLNEIGLSVFWDHAIVAGEGWDDRIEQELDLSRSVIVLWTALSRESRWVRNEARRGLERQVLIPVLAEDVRLPLEFADVQCENLIGWNGELVHRGWMRVVERIGRLSGREDLSLAAQLVGEPTISAFRKVVIRSSAKDAAVRVPHDDGQTVDGATDAPAEPVAAPGAPAAQPAPSAPAPLVTSIEEDELAIHGFTSTSLVEKLRDLGYRAEVETLSSGSEIVKLKMSGVNVVVSLYPKNAERKTSIQFYCGFKKSGDTTADKVNEFNKRYRFAKCYLDAEGDPVMEMDCFVNGVSDECFKEFVDMYETQLSSFRADVV